MTRQIKAHPMRNRSQVVGLHEVVLAGFGAASLARKQALKALDQLAVLTANLPEHAEALRERVGDSSQSFLDHAIVAADDLRIQAVRWASQAGDELQARAKPVLADLRFLRTRAFRTASAARTPARKGTRVISRRKPKAKSTGSARAN